MSDAEILAAYRELAATEGVFVEPASAASVAGLRKAVDEGLVESGRAGRVHGHRSRPEGPPARDRRGAARRARRRPARRGCRRARPALRDTPARATPVRACRSSRESTMMTSTRPIALVTGASSGIGRAFALAARRPRSRPGGRRPRRRTPGDARHRAARRLRRARARCSPPTSRSRSRSPAWKGGSPTPAARSTSLVNNAGFGTSGDFADLPIEREQQEIDLNVLALVRLTHAALGAMLERGRGGVVNVASIAAYQPTPGNATYGATKAFVMQLLAGRPRGAEGHGGEVHGVGARLHAHRVPGAAPASTRARSRASSGRTRRRSCSMRCGPTTGVGRCASRVR